MSKLKVQRNRVERRLWSMYMIDTSHLFSSWCPVSKWTQLTPGLMWFCGITWVPFNLQCGLNRGSMSESMYLMGTFMLQLTHCACLYIAVLLPPVCRWFTPSQWKRDGAVKSNTTTNGYFLRVNSAKTGHAARFRFLSKWISECLASHAIIPF